MVLNLWLYNNNLEHISKIQIPKPHSQGLWFSRSGLGPEDIFPRGQKLEKKKKSFKI